MAIADAMRMIDVEARVHALGDLEGSAAVAVPREISRPCCGRRPQTQQRAGESISEGA